MEITHHTKKKKELKLNEKNINRCQQQEDTDVGIIWQGF